MGELSPFQVTRRRALPLREVVNFGHVNVAFVTERRGDIDAVSCATVRSIMTEAKWLELERMLSFEAPEAQ